MSKQIARIRRAKKVRCKAQELRMPRLSVHRTPRHIYAQVILPGGKVVASVSTLVGEIKSEVAYGGNVQAATAVGKVIALRAKEQGVVRVVFDRSGFKYHGRVKALAESARAHGLEF